MDTEEMKTTLARLEEQVAELKAQLGTGEEGTATITHEELQASAVETGSAAEADVEDGEGLGDLLTALGQSGGLELLSALMGGKKGSLLSVVSAFAKQDGSEERLFDAMGSLGPEARKTARKLRGLWPVVQVVLDSGILDNLGKKNATTSHSETGRSQSRSHGLNHRQEQMATPVSRPIEVVQTERPQAWGAWSISRYSM